MTETNSNKLNSLIKDLFSNDMIKISGAIKKIKHEGNPTSIKPLLQIYFQNDRDEIKKEISDLLYTLKDEAAIPELIRELMTRNEPEEQNYILSIFWNCGLLPYEHIPLLVEKAIHGDYYTALETLTIIENMEGPFESQDIEDALFSSQMFLDENEESEKTPLLESINGLLNNFLEQE